MWQKATCVVISCAIFLSGASLAQVYREDILGSPMGNLWVQTYTQFPKKGNYITLLFQKVSSGAPRASAWSGARTPPTPPSPTGRRTLLIGQTSGLRKCTIFLFNSKNLMFNYGKILSEPGLFLRFFPRPLQGHCSSLTLLEWRLGPTTRSHLDWYRFKLSFFIQILFAKSAVAPRARGKLRTLGSLSSSHSDNDWRGYLSAGATKLFALHGDEHTRYGDRHTFEKCTHAFCFRLCFCKILCTTVYRWELLYFVINDNRLLCWRFERIS